ncbi:MAG: beta-ketoacyl-ACP synthase [Cyanophyceae cyanobacterium]
MPLGFEDPVVVTGLGVTTAFGNLDQSWNHLLAGDSALIMSQPFPELPPYPLAMIGKKPADLHELVINATQSALDDAQLWDAAGDINGAKNSGTPLKMGLVVGSSRGFQGRLEQECDRLSLQRLAQGSWSDDVDLSPWFYQALPQEVAIAVARHFRIQGPLSAPMAACATGLWSMMQGLLMLRANQCDQVLVIAADAPITPLCLSGFSRLGAIAKDGMYPFDIHRQGLSLGEGGAAFVLETQRHALERGASMYGKILGLGLTADGTHVTAPDETLTGVDRAIARCIDGDSSNNPNIPNPNAQKLKAAIAYVHAHGTGTRRNDKQEASIIQRWFSKGVAVSSTKGATGHTLGASGALGIAWSLLALKNQALPPCTGLQRPAFDLDFVLPSNTQIRGKSLDAVLCLAFGFGGQNGAIALGQPDF